MIRSHEKTALQKDAAEEQVAARAAQVALAHAVETANAKLAEGEAGVAEQKWESAIDLFTEGLKVDGLYDEECKSTLQAALDSAVSSMRARNKARLDAEELLQKGDALVSSREYEKAISNYEIGLVLDVQSEELKQRLKAGVAKVTAALAAQEKARKEAAIHVSTAEACMAEFDHKGAIRAYELALTIDVNDTVLTQSYVVSKRPVVDLYVSPAS